MKYFKSEDDKLIQYNIETNVYKIRNTIKKGQVLTQEDFEKLSTKQIKKDEFSRLMNIYFKNVKHEWKYEYSDFRKMDNFEEDNYSLSKNYTLGRDIPYHIIPGMEWIGKVLLVYHWGNIYYHTISYNGYQQGQLIHPTTHELVRWAKLKHCSPVFNIGTKKIC
ncbi:hypothetical protein M0Q50_10175 [bacterium]|jgi:hypothetical protein|nr:hypothetical protein [bacterium]